MPGELMRRVTEPSTAVGRVFDPQIVKAGRRVVARVQLADLEAQGAVALGQQIMNGVVELHRTKTELWSDDQALNMDLCDIVRTSVGVMKNIQRTALPGNFGL